MRSDPLEASAWVAESKPQKRFSNLRSVRWRIDLRVLPSSSLATIDDLRRAAADARRRYVNLRRRLMIGHHAQKDGNASANRIIDNPLSQNPDSTWGRFFSYAELGKMVDQDLCRLYPENGDYFHSPNCQATLRKVLVLWCLQHPEYGYRQGMHELLAPLLYVLHVDLENLSRIKKLNEDCFNDEFNGISLPESDLLSNDRIRRVRNWDSGIEVESNLRKKVTDNTLDALDPDTKEMLSLSDSYGAEGELGAILSERFMEHDAYCMFDNLMDGAQGVVAIASFYSTVVGSNTTISPTIEASLALYHLLSIVDSSLHSHLLELGVEPQYFALRWLRVLFGREFCLNNLLIIWDELFSSSNDSCVENVDECRFYILCSARGAFIAAFAVSMLLYLRSSLLSAEITTSCLQRLLNFPAHPDMKKIIEKAKSLQVLALESTSTLSKTSPYLRPDNYWEEQWRVLNKDEELSRKNGISSASGSIKKILTGKLSLSRTKSEASANAHADAKFSVRRRLFDDMPKSTEDEKHQDISNSCEASTISSDTNSGMSSLAILADNCMAEETLSNGDSSLVLSISTNPHEMDNDHENESVKSSVTSNSFCGDNSEEAISTEEPCYPNSEDGQANNMEEPCSQNLNEQLTQGSEANSSGVIDASSEQIAAAKDRKPSPGKFKWLWSFGRGGHPEGNQESQHSSSPEHIEKDSSDMSTCDETSTYCGATKRPEARDKKVIDSLRNLGQSMLDNIQVIETVFQQDKGKLDSLDNLSSNIVKGQGRAIVALKELRKISNLLQEM
ncbi:TBC1 domain family member 5-like [Zingiber officinale]|uniref:TBC1 domain family member 5-like n=1 Tax=Zingiber officinale TaxID=94328 RepID=UPI001C4BF70F|nr:TBC1 domain family member 5-like [Zingiber officinale]